MLIKSELRYIQILKDRGTCIDSRLEEIEEALKRGEKFEEMWKEYESRYGGLYLDISDSAMPINSEYVSTHRLMDETKQKYFPKPKSRWQRINDMVDNLNTIGRSTDIKKLVSLLIELRDEELKGSD